MRKHTPGPWFYQENSDAYTHIVRPESNPSSIIVHLRQSTSPEVEANARLIATVPDLYNAAEIAIIELAAVEHEIGVPSKALPLLRAAVENAEPAHVGADQSKPRYVRAQRHDRRVSRGDDFAGDAWRDTATGRLHMCIVGHDPNQTEGGHSAD